MEIEKLILKPGTIVLWKKYNPFIKLWSKIRYRKLPYNKYTILKDEIELLTLGTLKDVILMIPLKSYSKIEIERLKKVAPKDNNYNNWEEFINTVNKVRKNTFDIYENILESKYYEVCTLNEKLDYTIYPIK